MAFDIATQIEQWRKHLLDTTKRNRLINFKTGRTGGIALLHPAVDTVWDRLLGGGGLTFVWRRDLIDLPEEPEEEARSASEGPDPADLLARRPQVAAGWGPQRPQVAAGPPPALDVLQQCLRSPRLRGDDVVTELTDKRLAARLGRLALNARESQAEQGVTILFVAFGFLRWFESEDSQEEVRSPLLLVPVRLDRDHVEAPWRLRAEEEEVLPNFTLAQRLQADFKLRLPDENDVPLDPDEGCRARYLDAVREAVRQQRRWEVLDEAALGVFNFQKLAMWEDLGRNQARIGEHALCRSIAGDRSVPLAQPDGLPAAGELDDRTDPKTTYHILDADSSQHTAILTATSGANLVLDGPPGTGKSQTIANIIAEFLAAGKTVLFVSEKTAALEVVQRRLDQRGLGDFCLQLHSHKANKAEVMKQLDACLRLEPEPTRDFSAELRQLTEARQQLNSYVRALHHPRQPLGLSVFSVHGELARLSHLRSASRCAIPDVLGRDAGYVPRAAELLRRLPDCRGVLQERDRHPWRGCRLAVHSLSAQQDAEHHLARLAALLPSVEEAASGLSRLGVLREPFTVPRVFAAVTAAHAILDCPMMPPACFTAEPRALAQAIVQADEVSGRYRQVCSEAPELSPEAVCRRRPADVEELAARLGERRGVSPPVDTARGRLDRLRRVAEMLRQARAQAEALHAAGQQFVDLFRGKFRLPELDRLPDLAVAMEEVAEQGRVRRAWWDASRRQELVQVAQRARDEQQAATALRADLVARLSPAAFDRENAKLAAEASGYRSFLSRLWPGWWARKSRIAAWYPRGVPATGQLVSDLQKLAEYHQREGYIEELTARYAGDLLVGSGGKPDWQESLDAIEEFQQRIVPFNLPAALQDALTAEAKLDQVRPALASLRERVTAFTQSWQALAAEYDVLPLSAGPEGERPAPEEPRRGARGHRPKGARAAKAGPSTADVAAWLAEQVHLVEQQHAGCQQLVSLLGEGRDLPLDDVPARLRAAAEIARLYGTAESLGRKVVPVLTPDEVLRRDWARESDPARRLLGLLEGWPADLPPPVAALTSSQGRQELEAAVAAADALLEGEFRAAWGHLTQALFDPEQEVSTGIVLSRAPLAELWDWVVERGQDAHRLVEWVRYTETARELAALGAGSLLDEIARGDVELDEAADAFRARFFRLWLDAVYEQAAVFRQFSTTAQEALVDRFIDLDRRCIAHAADRIRTGLLDRPERPRAAGAVPETSELGVLLREVHKKRRHLPLRKLFAAIPTILLRLKPCLMMSPLSVSTYLDSPRYHFDLVIFDEASQVRPHDAICAIYRGGQVVVAGDQKQLPPTSFFDRALTDEDGEEDEDATRLADYESILDVCCTLGLPRRRLLWHYRSRRESLIAFANHHVYDNDLVTFPSVEDASGSAVRLEYVAAGRWLPGRGGGYNAVEARRTAELVLEHLVEHPSWSLGVIAFNLRQQERILDELEQLRKAHPELEEFFSDDADEPLFVKNLENVQGDERDVILLSVGYGPDADGKIAMRFGPLNRDGGERRLNVAVTRGRERVVVVSSLRADDIDLSRAGAVGVRLLRAYLDYAQNGPESLRRAVTEAGERDFESPFEQEVALALEGRGLTVHPQVGCGGFRIDLGIVDADRPGRYLLGVEGDGATYHSSATARDRDRLRQQVLESLGWHVCRVWSTDWLRDREGQVRRVEKALKDVREGRAKPRVRPLAEGARAEAGGGRKSRKSSGAGKKTPRYDSADEVPDEEVREQVLSVLGLYGATGEDDLIRAAARQLGWKATGPRIRERVVEALFALVEAGRVAHSADDNRWRLLEGEGAGE